MGIVNVQIPKLESGPYPEGRRCSALSCISPLSTYNAGPVCNACSTPMDESVDHRTALTRMEIGTLRAA